MGEGEDHEQLSNKYLGSQYLDPGVLYVKVVSLIDAFHASRWQKFKRFEKRKFENKKVNVHGMSHY